MVWAGREGGASHAVSSADCAVEVLTMMARLTLELPKCAKRAFRPIAGPEPVGGGATPRMTPRELKRAKKLAEAKRKRSARKSLRRKPLDET